VPGVKREKHQGRYIYLSDSAEIYTRQKQQWTTIIFPTDAQAVVILVQLIKHPDISIEKLAERVSDQGQSVEPATIRSFLQFHDLLKKTSDTKR
jgi:Fe2+ or Zn2+ uptake regulation protein